MNSAKVAVAVIVIIAVVGVFFLLPIMSYSAGGNPDYAFLRVRANANVSPSYIITGCGIVNNPNISTTLGAVHIVWDGARWICGTSWTQTSPS